ncbi:MNIO family bufferin maturase [Methylomonas sp. MgM2]
MTLIKQALNVAASIPALAGIGLRSPHIPEVLERRPGAGWFEVHSENYLGSGGAPLRQLERIRADYPISLHGVGLSLGSVDDLNRQHLSRLKGLIDRIQPGLVSEHLCWSSFGGTYLNDLLPLPYTEQTLNHLVTRIIDTQTFLGRRILLENPSTYLEYTFSTYSESAFMAELARRTGCGVLLDINNVYVSCVNHGWDADAYLGEIAPESVGEIHLAGHSVNRAGGKEILIDTHNAPVCAEVWELYRTALQRFGPRPTLIEWDADLPCLDNLLAEAGQADAVLERAYAQAA